MNKRPSLTAPSAQFYLSKSAFSDEPPSDHQFLPTKYCMCLNCGQELWADGNATTVNECFACRGQLTAKNGALQPPQATNSSDNIFLGALRNSRAISSSPRPESGSARRDPRSARPESGLGQTPSASSAQLPEKRTSGDQVRPGSGGGGGPDRVQSSGTFSEQLRRFRTEDYKLIKRTPSKEKVDSGTAARTSGKPTGQAIQVSLLTRQAQRDYDLQAATANSSKYKLEERRKKLNEIHGRDSKHGIQEHGDSASSSKEPASKPTQSQSTPNLPGIAQPLAKPSTPISTGNHMLDSVLGKLNKPKLMGALDRLVKEVGNNKKTLRAAFAQFDLNGDGILSKEEMAIGLRKLGVSLLPSELDAVMRALDVDQNGLVELDEVIEIVTAYRLYFKLDQAADKEKAEAQAEKEREKLKSIQSGKALTGATVGGRRPGQPSKLI